MPLRAASPPATAARPQAAAPKAHRQGADRPKAKSAKPQKKPAKRSAKAPKNATRKSAVGRNQGSVLAGAGLEEASDATDLSGVSSSAASALDGDGRSFAAHKEEKPPELPADSFLRRLGEAVEKDDRDLMDLRRISSGDSVIVRAGGAPRVAKPG